MKVYPWKQRKYRSTTRALSGPLRRVSTVLWPLAAIISIGLTLIARFWATRGFAKVNDHWAKRGVMMVLIGLILLPLIGAPAQLGHAWADLIRAIDGSGDSSTLSSIIRAALAGLPIGLILQGLSSMMDSFDFDVSGERYLEPTRPTLRTKRRAKKSTTALESGNAASKEMVPFGVVVGDPIPFRTPRYGMVLDRRFTTLGHGSVVGANGTGKTVLAIQLGYTAVEHGAALIYVDFKASMRTYKAVKAIADDQGASFQFFTSGLNLDTTSWYDPLAWEGDAADKASMLITSFNFPETGDASYYRNQAETWLVLCFQVLEFVGLNEGESTFDYLLAVTDPVELKGRMTPMRNSRDPQAREAYQSFMDRASRTAVKDLSGLYSNLSTVVHSGGEQLRPQGRTKPVSLADAARDGGVVYVGLSPSINDVALKILGSLVIRDLSVLSGKRMHQHDVDQLRPVMLIIDEASRLGHRAVVVETVLATSREGRIFLWSFTQSFSTWPVSTITELNTNANTKVAFRTQDPDTRKALEQELGETPALNEISGVSIKHRHFQGDTTTRDEESRNLMTEGRFLMNAPYAFDSLPDMHAYVWGAGDLSGSAVFAWQSRRVKDTDIEKDAPLIRVVPLSLSPAAPVDKDLDVVSPAAEIEEQEPLPADGQWVGAFDDPYDHQDTPEWDRPPSDWEDSLDDGPAPLGRGAAAAQQYPRRSGSTPATATADTTTSTRTNGADATAGSSGHDAHRGADAVNGASVSAGGDGDGVEWDDEIEEPPSARFDPNPIEQHPTAPPEQPAQEPELVHWDDSDTQEPVAQNEPIWDDDPSPDTADIDEVPAPTTTPAPTQDPDATAEFAELPDTLTTDAAATNPQAPTGSPQRPTPTTTPPPGPAEARPRPSAPKLPKGSKAARWE